jgi:site-specific recombinase XerC
VVVRLYSVARRCLIEHSLSESAIAIESLQIRWPHQRQTAPYAIRVLFDWLILGQVIPMNPSAAVRGSKYVVKRGKTPVLKAEEARQLLDCIPTEITLDEVERIAI